MANWSKHERVDFDPEAHIIIDRKKEHHDTLEEFLEKCREDGVTPESMRPQIAEFVVAEVSAADIWELVKVQLSEQPEDEEALENIMSWCEIAADGVNETLQEANLGGFVPVDKRPTLPSDTTATDDRLDDLLAVTGDTLDLT